LKVESLIDFYNILDAEYFLPTLEKNDLLIDFVSKFRQENIHLFALPDDFYTTLCDSRKRIYEHYTSRVAYYIQCSVHALQRTFYSNYKDIWIDFYPKYIFVRVKNDGSYSNDDIEILGKKIQIMRKRLMNLKKKKKMNQIRR
jgi:hypothetical protein